MLTKTTISALRVLIYLGRMVESGDEQGMGQMAAQSPARMAVDLGESPTYLAKVTGQLVKGGILRAERGAKGGVRLGRPPAEITLLSVVEACQGTIVGNFCQMVEETGSVCAFHLAGLELHQAIVRTLSKWNLGHLLERPAPRKPLRGGLPCVLGMAGLVAVAPSKSGKTKKRDPGK